MSTDAEGMKLAIRAYLATMGVTVLIALFTIVFLVDTGSCSSVSRALAVLGGTTAVVFLASVIVVGIRAWKVVPSVVARLAILFTYGAVLLASFAVMTCGLMVVFNC
jgi:hypothetical protein